MSGICGIVGLGGPPPDEAAMRQLLKPLERRGPDGTGSWIGDDVALGHALLATTAEALVEKLPLHDPGSGCSITADTRLDNRDDLIHALGLGREAKLLGDGELILRAYLKWGEGCPSRLLGDFAFAIWDARRRRLFCARDQMGMRQLAYCHMPGRALVFATEPGAVVRHPLVPKQINEGRLADYLDDLEHGTLTETFYSAVLRLPPAHSLTVDGSGLAVSRYWELPMPPELKLKTDGDYAEAFLDTFEPAVACRLRSAGGVGSMLSGGLDSGSVCAVAAGILERQHKPPLATFSIAGPDPRISPETRAIEESSRMPGIEPHIIRLNALDPYIEDLVRLTKEQDEPFDRQMGLVRTAYLAAHRAGLKIVLDGVAGDIVLSGGDYVGLLLRTGRLASAWREAQGQGRFWSSAAHGWRALARGAWSAWAPTAVADTRRRAAWWLRDRRIGRSGLISSPFSASADLRGRRQKARLPDGTLDLLDRNRRAQAIGHSVLAVGRERYDRVASALAIEPRDPFMDLRVIEFCLSLPGNQLQSGGWPKILLRRAMAGKLPDFVRWRTGREHLGLDHMMELFGRLQPADVPAARIRETIERFVHSAKVPASPLGRDGEDCKDWIDAICLYYWLESAGRTLDAKFASGGNRS